MIWEDIVPVDQEEELLPIETTYDGLVAIVAKERDLKDKIAECKMMLQECKKELQLRKIKDGTCYDPTLLVRLDFLLNSM